MVRDLLAWWEIGRRDFPWRSWSDLYRLLLAELLLRQTRAETVAVFLPAFLHDYPSAGRLSRATEEELAARLRPLGLSRQRAAQLRALGAALAADRPDRSREALSGLPGIGRYSAAMVAAASGGDGAAVDTNVARVVCRVFGLEPSHAEARKSINVWELADQLATFGKPAEVTWAMLDLAALICVSRRPRCPQCPLQSSCLFAAAAESLSPSSGGPGRTRRRPG